MTATMKLTHLSAGDRWEAMVNVPGDAVDLGLHRDAHTAAARFRQQLPDAIGTPAAAEYGARAEQEFLLHRAALEASAAVWAGFVVTATIDLASRAGVDPHSLNTPPADGEVDVVMLALLVAITEFPDLPQQAVLPPAVALSRLLQQRYGEGAATHVLDYDGRPAAAAVHVTELPLAGQRLGGRTLPDNIPPAEQLVAEVHVIFPEAKAVATVSAATLNPANLNHAVLAAGMIARTVRVRAAATASDEQ